MTAADFINKFGWDELAELPKASFIMNRLNLFWCNFGIKKEGIAQYFNAYELAQKLRVLERVKKALDGKYFGYMHFYLHSNGIYVFLDHYNDFIFRSRPAHRYV